MDVNVAQKFKTDNNSSAVVMAHALPVLAGRPILMTWYGAMAEALKKKDEELVFRLFEAGMSVPIRLRLCPDGDTCHLAGLQFSEALFAASASSGATSFWAFAGKVRRLNDLARAFKDNVSITKIKDVIKKYGLTFKGNAVSDANVKALKALLPFLEDEKCNEAHDLVESICPEVGQETILMRIAQLSSARATTRPTDAMVFALECLLLWRITGTFKGKYNVESVTGQEKKTTCAGAYLLQEARHRRVHFARTFSREKGQCA